MKKQNLTERNDIAMKKAFFLFMIAVFVISLCACTQQDIENMTTEISDGCASIVWKDNTYVPYGALSAYGDRGKQIGIVDGNKDHKVYECKGYSSDEWIVTALPHDAAMLLREIDVTDIPDGWQSEYEWNQ